MSNLKQVRFATQKTVYPPKAFIPPIDISFSFSLPSSSSSHSRSPTLSPHRSETDGFPGPSVFIRNPGPRLPASPIIHAGQQSCHPLLQSSALRYDLRDRVSTVTTTHHHHHHPLSIDTLHESAFVPPRSYITIISSYLPWTIKVYASNGSYITLQDILTSIYSDLRTNITPTEFQLLPSQHHRNRATRAYQQRYRRLRRPQLPGESEREYHHHHDKALESEKRAGMKRVDFLMSHTKFLGIGWQRGDEWKLHVASPTMKL